MLACVAAIVTEVLFGLSTDGTGFAGILSHLYKVATAWLVYLGISALKQGEDEMRLMLTRGELCWYRIVRCRYRDR